MAEAVKEVVAEKKETNSGEKNTGMAIITYFIFFIPFLTGDVKDPFIKYHTKQSTMLVIASVILNTVMGISIFLIPLIPLLGLGTFVLWIMGVMNASKGVEEPLPVIGKYAEEYLKF
jgi:uncharacterized membrane protein